MVSPTCCAPSEAGGRRYSRHCPPYSFTYPDRRFHLSSHDNRAIIMTDREESDQPRKRIAVAVSSQETPFKENGDYGYNLDAARTYAHQSRGAISPLAGSLHPYAHEMTGAGAAGTTAATAEGVGPYRHSSTYPYSGKGYYSAVPGWANTYPDDGGVDYGLSYPSYQVINSDPVAPLVPAYGQYGSRKSLYVEPETSSYSYGGLGHRPAINSDTQGFSLSSMAASLPSATDRILSSDRLHSGVNRALTGSTGYRGDSGLAPHYANPATTNNSTASSAGTNPSAKTASAGAISDLTYGNLHPFESSYSAASTMASAMASTLAQRTPGLPVHAETSAYTPGPDLTYAPSDQSMRAAEDASSGLSYVYSDTKLGGSRRESRSGRAGTGSLLSNGHVYVPDSHTAHAPSHNYIIPPSSSAQRSDSIEARSGSGGSGTGGGNASGSGTGNVRLSGSSVRPSDSHRRSAGSLRGT
ncbi:hypothetical protein GGS20DRAFT_594361 [Poronia punctata]|nr:hypothetical protein GGS20DRAFT_594361 [Poronia punctata]